MDPYPSLPLFTDGNGNYFYNDLDLDYATLWSAVPPPNQTGGLLVGGAMLAGGPPPPGGTNSGSGGGGTSMALAKFGSNDLYLSIAQTASGEPTNLVIHPPWYVTNGVYNVLSTTNLAPPIAWQPFATTTPGQTNIMLTNATDPQRFFALGLTNSSAGTDFWLAFESMYAAQGFDPTFQLSIYVSSQTTNTGTVTVPGLGFSTNFSLVPGTVAHIAFTNGNGIYSNGWGVVCTNGIHVVAAQPVSVYGFYYYVAFSAAFTAYPTPMLGTNYCLMSRPSLIDDYPSFSAFSQFAVLATEDGTSVSITPSASTYLAGQATNVTLDQGCLYQVSGGDDTGDVTGTLITSDKPIAVFAGASEAYVPYENQEAANPLVQEQLPVEAWGNQVLALSFGRPGGDSYRVLCATNTTVVITTTNGVLTNNLAAGQPYDAILDGPVQFQASNPIQVAQFALGGDDTNYLVQGIGDPCEILLPSTGHYLTSCTVAIQTNDYVTGDFDTNFLNVIIPQSAIATTIMDGVAITNFAPLANFEQVGSSDYSAARIPVAPGSTHAISSSQPVEVEVYGFAVPSLAHPYGEDAYGYIGGLSSFP
ncbi:MAG: IgGFc-binding protein [Limisphaerales bacterium]